jgi:hypothetical protein
VRLLDEKGASIAEAIVGKRRYDAFGSMKGGTYVRKPGDVQTWLANADIDASPRVRDWVEPGVFDLGTRKITQMTIELPGEQPLKIEQDSAGAGKYKLVSIPDGKKLKQGTDVDAIPRAAGFIEMDDVRKLAQTPVGDVNTVNIAAEGGLSIVMRLRKQGDDYWLSMTATGEGDAKKAAETITSKVQGWEFKIPLSKAQAILKRPADLFEAS